VPDRWQSWLRWMMRLADLVLRATIDYV